MTYEFHMFQPDTGSMREELTRIGFQELRAPAEVDAALGNAGGTALVFVNSVCGCAGGIARPAVAMALARAPRPDRLLTVFAGQDKEATARAREFFTGYPPSSPSMALLKDGQLVHMVERRMIEGRDPGTVAAELAAALRQYCRAPARD